MRPPLINCCRIAAWSAAFLGLLSVHVGVSASQVLILMSEAGGPYQEAVQAIRTEMTRAGIAETETVSRNLVDLEDLDLEKAKVAIALGAKASQRLAGAVTQAPVISALIPKAVFEQIALENNRAGDLRRFSAVYLDQPYARQLRLIELALPDRKNLLVLAGETSPAMIGSLAVIAKSNGFRFETERVTDESQIYPALTRRLGTADVLLALPDARVMNSRTARGLLLTAYRFQVPVVAFSAAYAKAGALLSLSSTPTQMGTQAAQAARQVLAGQLPPASAYPTDFVVDLNDTVARSLDIRLTDAAKLRQQLLGLEEKP